MILRSAWRHQSGLQPDVAVTHLALDLGARHEGGDRVDDDDVQGPGAHQHVDDLEGLLTGVRLGYEQGIGVDAEVLGVVGVQGVLRVDERRDAPLRLRVRDGVQRDGRLTAGLRSEDLDDPPAGQTTDAQRTSRAMEPVGITAMGAMTRSPRRMTEPLPNCLSICERASPSAFSRSGCTAMSVTPEFAVFVGVRLFTLTR